MLDRTTARVFNRITRAAGSSPRELDAMVKRIGSTTLVVLLAMLPAVAQAEASRWRRGDARPTERAQPPIKETLHIIISLAEQSLRVHGTDGVLLTSRVSTGQPGHRTPTGIFSVIQKKRFHESNIYSGAPMPFMQRITWSGIALHAGVLPGYPASHGCIRLPAGVAARLFAMTKVGARVIVTERHVTPVDFAHPRLPVVSQATPSPYPETRLAQAEPSSDGDPPGRVAPASPPVAADRPIAILVSRREQKLYVRQNLAPLFDVPVYVEDPDAPMGTHLFTAIGPSRSPSASAGELSWKVLSFAASPDGSPTVSVRRSTHPASPVPETGATAAEEAADTWNRTPTAALTRLEIPAAARRRIMELLAPGSSLLITDQGLGLETGKGTDFIVLSPDR
jgi:hypothetical protein